MAAVEQTPALIPAGVAVKLSFILCYLDESWSTRRAILSGMPIAKAAVKADDFRTGMLLHALEDLKRMAAA